VAFDLRGTLAGEIERAERVTVFPPSRLFWLHQPPKIRSRRDNAT
jgi:hypothetical protein